MEVYSCPVFQDNSYLAWHLGITDFGIFLCYIIIPMLLFKVIRLLPRSITSELKIFAVLLSIFVISCGFTHLIKVGLLTQDLWTVAIVMNWICLAASMISAIYLYKWGRPKLIKLVEKFNLLLKAETSKDILTAVKIVRSILLDE